MPPFVFPWKLEHPAGIANWQWALVSVIGFVILAVIVGKWILPSMITVHLVKRRQDIADADAQVRETLRQTEAMRSDYQARLEGIEDETERRMQQAVQEAAETRERILAEAQQSVDALVRRGEEEVVRERAKAMIHLRSQFVDSVVRAAEYAAARSIEPAHQSRLVDEFIQKVGTQS